MTDKKLTRREVQQRQRERSGLLTTAEVARIKFLLNNGSSARQLAAAYCMSKGAIDAIRRGDSWSWVEAEEAPIESYDLPPMTPEQVAEAEASALRLGRILRGEEKPGDRLNKFGARPKDAQFLTDGSKFGARSNEPVQSTEDKPKEDSQT